MTSFRDIGERIDIPLTILHLIRQGNFSSGNRKEKGRAIPGAATWMQMLRIWGRLAKIPRRPEKAGWWSVSKTGKQAKIR
ncbi:hypothetical protein DPMN_079792 [Dreissena polymorpha]|uniref:Uncharacterized protein n=1 Tax=Dreissena polymorpha TaxID=45954 RepID=A0A9D4BIN2_DREPO|nr:hypothetical protein DPMN_079792 [Dreissena polymorpha]